MREVHIPLVVETKYGPSKTYACGETLLAAVQDALDIAAYQKSQGRDVRVIDCE